MFKRELRLCRADDGAAGFGASFHGVNKMSLMPIIAGGIALFFIVVTAIAVLVVCFRRLTSSKAAAAAVVVGGMSSASGGTAASSALLAGQRTSCGGSSVTATPQQLDKRQLHHQYAELRERPGGVVTHCSRLTRLSPSPSPPALHHQPPTTTSARATNVGSPFSSYSSMCKTGLPVTAVSQPHHHQYQLQQTQQAFQLQQQQQLPHIQYYERC